MSLLLYWLHDKGLYKKIVLSLGTSGNFLNFGYCVICCQKSSSVYIIFVLYLVLTNFANEVLNLYHSVWKRWKCRIFPLRKGRSNLKLLTRVMLLFCLLLELQWMRCWLWVTKMYKLLIQLAHGCLRYLLQILASVLSCI